MKTYNETPKDSRKVILKDSFRKCLYELVKDPNGFLYFFITANRETISGYVEFGMRKNGKRPRRKPINGYKTTRSLVRTYGPSQHNKAIEDYMEMTKKFTGVLV